jgi:hypothetical protein
MLFNYANNIFITKVLFEQFCASWKIIKRGKKNSMFFGVFIARINKSCDFLIRQKTITRFVY